MASRVPAGLPGPPRSGSADRRRVRGASGRLSLRSSGRLSSPIAPRRRYPLDERIGGCAGAPTGLARDARPGRMESTALIRVEHFFAVTCPTATTPAQVATGPMSTHAASADAPERTGRHGTVGRLPGRNRFTSCVLWRPSPCWAGPALKPRRSSTLRASKLKGAEIYRTPISAPGRPLEACPTARPVRCTPRWRDDAFDSGPAAHATSWCSRCTHSTMVLIFANNPAEQAAVSRSRRPRPAVPPASSILHRSPEAGRGCRPTTTPQPTAGSQHGVWPEVKDSTKRSVRDPTDPPKEDKKTSPPPPPAPRKPRPDTLTLDMG